MSSSITSRADATAGVLLLAFAWGCAGTPSAGRCTLDPKPPQPTPPPAADCERVPAPKSPALAAPPSFATDGRMVKIVTFDCIKAEDAQEGAQPADTLRISKWTAGGPGGATWNATDLLCFADIETSCDQGELSSALRVGQRRVADQKTAIAQAGSMRIQLSASERLESGARSRKGWTRSAVSHSGVQLVDRGLVYQAGRSRSWRRGLR
jgi:hypothetical protein